MDKVVLALNVLKLQLVVWVEREGVVFWPDHLESTLMPL